MLQITWFLVMVVIYQTVGLPLLLCKNENGTTVNETSRCTASNTTITFTIPKPAMTTTGNANLENATLEDVHNFYQNAHLVGLKKLEAQDCHNCSAHNNSNPGVQMGVHGSTTENAIGVSTTNNSSLNQGKEIQNNPDGVQMEVHGSTTENAIGVNTTNNSSLNQDKEIKNNPDGVQMEAHGSTTENAIGVITTNNSSLKQDKEIKNNPDGVQMGGHGSTTENAIGVNTTNNSSLNQDKEIKNNPDGVQMEVHGSTTENAIGVSTTNNSSLNQDKEIKNNPDGVQMEVHGSTTENAIGVSTTNNSSLNQDKEIKNNPDGVQMEVHGSTTENAIGVSTTNNSSLNQDKEIKNNPDGVQMEVHGSTTENAIGVSTTNSSSLNQDKEIENNLDDSALFEEGIPVMAETYTTEEPIFLQRWKTFRITAATNNEDVLFPSASDELTSTATVDKKKLAVNNYPVLNDSLIFENEDKDSKQSRGILSGNEEKNNITSYEVEFEPVQPCIEQIRTQPISFPKGTNITEDFSTAEGLLCDKHKIDNSTVSLSELIYALSNKTTHDNALKILHKLLKLAAPDKSLLYENDDSESELFGTGNVELTTAKMIKDELEHSKHTDLGEIVFNPEVFVPQEDEYNEVADDSKIITNLNTSALNDTVLFMNEYPEYSYEDDE